MPVNVILPHMGLTTLEGTIVKWLKKEGDIVKKDEPLVEVLTDKVNNVVEAPEAGVLLKIVQPEGAVVPVTQTLCWIGQAGETIPTESEPVQESAATAAPAPMVAESPTVAMAVETPVVQSGYVKASPIAKRLAKEQGLDIARIPGTGPGGRVVERDVLKYADTVAQGRAEVAASPEHIKASPLARNLAKEFGLDLATINGSGPGGRITREDVITAAERAKTVAPTVPAAPAAPAPAVGGGLDPWQGGIGVPVPLQPANIASTVPLTGLRKIIAQRMSQSAHTIPRVTHTTEVDMTEIVRMRKQLVASTEKALGFRISYNDIIIKVVARALRDHPMMNARLAETEVQLLENVNVGMAVAIPTGLVVPVIHDADKKDLTAVAREAREKADKARKGALSGEDMSGGTFTVTNLGGYEIDAFSPIINLPEVGILGIGRIVEKPAVCNGEICVRSMMYLSLTFDHRVNDGAPAADFLRTIKHYLEQPFTLLI